MSHDVQSPVPGTFYRAPDPDTPPFVEEGDTVTEGDTLCLVELMKNFMEVKATASGTVTSILVENEATVTAGQPLVVIEADG